MKIFENAISNGLNKKCTQYIKDKISQKDASSFCWKLSTFSWSSNLTRGILGQCNITPAPEDLKIEIVESLKNIYPQIDIFDIFVSFYVWGRLSGINWHSDEKYDGGITIYLNEYWDYDWGGIFLWKDEKYNEINGLIPTKNTLVFNDMKEIHYVTPINPLCQEPRMTIQIFIEKSL